MQFNTPGFSAIELLYGLVFEECSCALMLLLRIYTWVRKNMLPTLTISSLTIRGFLVFV